MNKQKFINKNKQKFINKLDAACMKMDPEPEHGATAYLDVIELLMAMYVIAPGDDITVCRDVVLEHMAGPTA